MKSTKQIIV